MRIATPVILVSMVHVLLLEEEVVEEEAEGVDIRVKIHVQGQCQTEHVKRDCDR